MSDLGRESDTIAGLSSVLVMLLAMVREAA
jgi:hypothetical protein